MIKDIMLERSSKHLILRIECRLALMALRIVAEGGATHRSSRRSNVQPASTVSISKLT